jgi:hypothetical protein
MSIIDGLHQDVVGVPVAAVGKVEALANLVQAATNNELNAEEVNRLDKARKLLALSVRIGKLHTARQAASIAKHRQMYNKLLAFARDLVSENSTFASKAGNGSDLALVKYLLSASGTELSLDQVRAVEVLGFNFRKATVSLPLRTLLAVLF